MKPLLDLIIFIIANTLGFFSVALVYLVSLQTGLISIEILEQNAVFVKNYYMGGTIGVWLVAATLSFGFFIMKRKERVLFLALPVVIPTLYGFSVLLKLSSVSPL